MKTDNLSPEKSFDLITQVITAARDKFQENGFIYMFWGILLAVTSIGQFLLLKNGFSSYSYYPYFLMPFGGLFTWFYYAKKARKTRNVIGSIVGFAWVTLSLNMMVLGFLFAPVLSKNLIPVLLILLSAGVIISGTSIKSSLLIISGIIINVSAFICFKIDWLYHPLVMGIVSIVAVLIPGLVLMMQYKKKKNV